VHTPHHATGVRLTPKIWPIGLVVTYHKNNTWVVRTPTQRALLDNELASIISPPSIFHSSSVLAYWKRMLQANSERNGISAIVHSYWRVVDDYPATKFDSGLSGSSDFALILLITLLMICRTTRLWNRVSCCSYRSNRIGFNFLNYILVSKYANSTKRKWRRWCWIIILKKATRPEINAAGYRKIERRTL